MPQIGVVIPLYNGERYLAETVESVLAQTFADWELVIVDDGSTDGSAAIADVYVEQDPRIRLIRRPNGGVATARNAGFHALGSGCEFVSFLDQDDIWYPESLMTLHSLLAGDLQASAAHGTHHPMDATGHRKARSNRELLHRGRWGFEGTRLVRWPSERPTTFDVLAFMNQIITPGLTLIRRSALLSAGGFDQRMAPADDWDLWLRIAAGGYLAYTDTAVLQYRTHDANVSLHMELMKDAISAVRRKHAGSMILDHAQRSLLVRGQAWVSVWEHWFVSVLRLIWAREHWQLGHYWRAIKDLRHAVRERYSFEIGRICIRGKGTIRP